MTVQASKLPRRVAFAMLDVLALVIGAAIALPFFLVLCLPFLSGL